MEPRPKSMPSRIGPLVALSGALVLHACSSGVISSRSYKGHESDRDADNFVSTYPHTLGTRLDDCQTCHRGGTFSYERRGEIATTYKNPCDFCHLTIHPSEDFIEDQPTTYAETLNRYGTAYLEAGRSGKALEKIAGTDSDGDGFSNLDEIDDRKYPGDANSVPGQEAAPAITFTMERLEALASHDQFLLVNSHKQRFDSYSAYVGVPVAELLAAAGVDLDDPALEGITVIAPDGYMKDFTVGEIERTYPNGRFYGGWDVATLGDECGVVTYPDTLPGGLTDGGEIPGDPLLMLAYERDGRALDPSNPDITSGKIRGEGPFRLVVPQSLPGAPDRGSSHPTDCGDGRDYDDEKDHNAGAMVRGVVAIRVNPLPDGCEDFDRHNGGWAYVDNESLIVYGHGVMGD